MTKIGTQVANVTRDSDTTFKVRRSKVNLHGRGHIVAHSLLYPALNRRGQLAMMLSDVCLSVAYIGPKSRTEA